MSSKMTRTLREIRKLQEEEAALVPFDMRMGFEITKVDVEKRILEGVATSERKDAQGDIIPFDVSQKTFEKQFPTIGVREMHQPRAVGFPMAWWPIAETKQIGVRLGISRSRDGDDVLTKCREGTLKGLSIAGKANMVDYDIQKQARIIKDLSLTEISVVDVPANPDARIMLVKFADIEKAVQHIPNLRHIEANSPLACFNCQHMRNFGAMDDVYCRKFDSCVQRDWLCDGWEKESEHPDAEFIPLADAGASSASTSDSSMALAQNEPPVAKALEPAAAPVEPPVGQIGILPIVETINPDKPTIPAPQADPHQVQDADRRVGKVEKDVAALLDAVTRLNQEVKDITKADADEKEKLENELKARGRRVGISRKDGEPLTPPKGYPTDWTLYADPANWSWPCNKDRASTAVGYYNGGKGKNKYSATEWNTLGRRIARIASAQTGSKYNFSGGEIKREEEKGMSNNMIEKAKDLAGVLQGVKDQLKALREVGVDPEAMKGALAQIISAMEVAEDTARTIGTESPSAAEPSTSGVRELAAGTTTETPSSPSSPESTPSTPGKMTPMAAESDTKYAAMEKAVNDLSAKFDALMGEIKKGRAPEVSPSAPPAGFIPPTASTQVDPLSKAILDGKMNEAMKLVDGDVGKLYATANDMALKQLSEVLRPATGGRVVVG